MRPFFNLRPVENRRGRKTSRTLRHSNRGTTAIEFAMLFPVYLLMLFGVIEFGRLLWTQSTLQQAVEAAARCASVDPSVCSNSSTTANYAAAQMYGLNVSAGVFSVASPPPSCGNQVSANLPFNFIVSSLFPWQLTLTAQSCFPLQS